MKRYFYLTAAITGLLMAASCQKEDFAAAEGDYAEVSFTADLPTGVATKAIADGQTVNTLRYEVYATHEDGATPSGDPVYDSYVAVTQGKATVNVRLIKNKPYTVFFWAQYEKDGKSPYYGTDNLQNITVDYTTNKSSNDEFRDAFYYVAKGVKYTGASTETIELKRPFAQVNVATSDLQEVLRQGERPLQTTLTVTGVSNEFDLFNATATVPVEEITASFSDAYIPGLNDSNKTTYTVADVDDLTAGGNDYDYLSMAYVLVPGGKDDTSVSTLTAKVTYSSDVTATISYEGATLQKNRRTNLIGQLLTTSADYEIIVDEEFDKPDHAVINTVSELQNKLSTNTSTKAVVYNVTLESQENIEIEIPDSFVAENVEFNFEEVKTGSNLTIKDADNASYDKTVTIKLPADVKINELTIELPEGHVDLMSGQVSNVNSNTSSTTLVVNKGVKIEQITVNKGNVEIKKESEVKSISVGAENEEEVILILDEGVDRPAVTGTTGKLVVKETTESGEVIESQIIIGKIIIRNENEDNYTEYDDLATAISEYSSGSTIVLGLDICLTETLAFIDSNTDIVIDLNGFTISGESTATGKNWNLIDVNKGKLTIKNGIVTTKHIGENMGWNNSTNVFNVTAGGVLNIENSTIENLGGSDMAFCVHLNNWGEVTLDAKNTDFKSPYVGIRAFNSGSDMNNITLDNCDIQTGNSCIWVHNYTIADFGNNAEQAEAAAKRLNFNLTNTNLARTNDSKYLIRFGFTNSIYYSDIDMTNVVAGTADALVWTLENNKNVLFNNDIKIDPANMSNAYGKTGINVKNGQTIDGNNFTLDVKGAGGTWDSGINTTGGLIKNIKVTGSFRGIFINHNSTHSEPVVLENVTIDGTTYTVSCDQGLNQTLKATGSTFNGWTSYAATLGNASFEDCNFGKSNGYAYCRPYAPTTFKDCNFAEGFQLDPQAKVTFENCKINGVVLTAENLSILVTSNIANAEVK